VGEVQDTGMYTIRWDASVMAAGMYFCRLDAGGTVLTGKMMLVK